MTRILIADDHPTVRRGLRHLIESHREWQVCGEAVDGRDAINRAQELKPDILVLDLMMPKMNGLDAARQVTRLIPGVQILLCTVQLSSNILTEAQKAGIPGAVSKSKVWQITDGIAALLRNEKYYSQAPDPPLSQL